MGVVTEFCLLGPVLVRRGGVVLPVAPGKQRAVLAALLLSAGRVVSLDELAEVLWGPAPPPSARVAVQNHVMKLRQALGDGARIGTHPRGYQIVVDDAGLDVSRFEAYLAGARAAARDGSWDAAAEQARAGLALWRGEPLADVDSDLLAARDVPRLAELRLQAVEVALEADLRLGRPGEVITEARRLAAADPLRERLHGLLMRALYQDGRQAEALAAYARARQVLVDELGTEPGAGLRELHRQILNGDPALDAPAPVRGAAISPPPPVPRQLPAAVADFTGRAAELATLTRMLDQADAGSPGTVVISAIGGTAGVGKTALALHWAHQAAARFPGGQLYVNLRGFDPGRPATAAGALAGFLRALGVPGPDIPAGEEQRAARYRSQLAGRRMLIVLDNARDEQQVRPLLPGTTGCAVLVTSRSQLAGLAAAGNARLLSLDVLSHDEARHMLAARIGSERAAAEPAAADQIASLCGRLPLALAVAAARAAARPGFPLATLAAELGDRAGRLDALDTGDPTASVRAVFSWSYRQLSAAAARMFRLLGLHPGPDISVLAAASLAATAQADARRLLAELTRAHLVAEHVPGRYALHDLLRSYAAEQARVAEDEPARHEAIGRILDHYLHTARAASTLIRPARDPVTIGPPLAGVTPEHLVGPEQALAWFEAEHQVLLAAVALADSAGFDVHAWQVPATMSKFMDRRGHWQLMVAIQGTALAAATRLGDSAGQAVSLWAMAMACSRLGDYEQALAHTAACLRLCRQLGDRLGQADAYFVLATVAESQGRYADALGHCQQALRQYWAAGSRPGQARMLNNIAWDHGLLGHYRQARQFCQQSLALTAELDLRDVAAAAWGTLGYAQHHLGQLAEAAACYQRSLSLFREFGDRFREADILTLLGDTCHAADELAEAREAWRQALAILEDLRHHDAAKVRAKLARHAPLGDR
jgi:DNA-binding SARP family transcriptional activator/tetratricopeptide (TPR) repeat protein